MKQIKRNLKKMSFWVVNHLPAVWRDRIYRSRLSFKDLPENVTIEIATERKDLDQAFKILHDAYVKEGFSKPHQNGRRVTDYHILPSTTTVVAKHEGKVIGTISIIRDSVFGLPVDNVVNLKAYREKGERLGEVSSLAIRPDYRGNSGVILFFMFKYIVHYSLHYFGIDRFVIVVNPSRRALYQSLLTFTPLKRKVVSSYQFANNAPGLCMTLNLKKADEIWGAVYRGMPEQKNLHHFFFGGFSPAQRERMHFPERQYHTVEDPVMTPDIMAYFFKQCTDGLCGLSDQKIKILRNIYREPSYDDVWPHTNGGKWQNLRKDQRFDVACTGLLRGQQPKAIKLRVLNASRTGVQIQTDENIDVDTTARLSIAVGNQAPVAVDARTCWVKGRLCGLEIVHANSVWDRFIDYLDARRTNNVSAAQAGRQKEEVTTAANDCIAL